MSECFLCNTIRPGTRGAIPEAFADLAVVCEMINFDTVPLCLYHYGRLFWPAAAYAEVAV